MNTTPQSPERGVSPVVIIAVVAIALVLAAVLAVTVLDFGSDNGEESTSVVEIVQDGDDVTVTWVEEAHYVSMEISVWGAGLTCDDQHFADLENVGESTTATCGTEAGTMTVSGETVDGSEEVVRSEELGEEDG